MIDNLQVTYTRANVTVTLTAKTAFDDNLPFNLVEIFTRVVEDSDANKEMVVGHLANWLGVDITIQKKEGLLDTE